MKKEDEKARTEKASLFPSKHRKREKHTCILTKESIIQLVLSQTRSFEEEEEEEERGQRERLLHSRKAE